MIRGQRKLTLSEKAYEEIKGALIDGRIRMGELLSESHLAEALGTSRTPVREALRHLENEGIVEIHNGVGAYVRPISAKEVEDLYEVRRILELYAIRTSIYAIGTEELDELEQEFRDLLMQVSSGNAPDPKEFSELDWKLHDLLVKRSSNQYIRSIMQNNSFNLRRTQTFSAEVLHDMNESIRQHLEILDLIRKRDLQELTQKLAEHLGWAASLAAMGTPQI